MIRVPSLALRRILDRLKLTAVPREFVLDAAANIYLISDDDLHKFCQAYCVDPSTIPIIPLRTPSPVGVLKWTDSQRRRRTLASGGRDLYHYFPLVHGPQGPSGYILEVLWKEPSPPAQSSGHLEPAITLALGPTPVTALWQESSSTLRANPDPTSIVTGDTYAESPCCPHTYEKHGPGQALIASFPVCSGTEEAIQTSDSRRVAAHAESLIAGPLGQSALAFDMSALRYDEETLAREARVVPEAVRAALQGGALEADEARRVARVLGEDYRRYLSCEPQIDTEGKRILRYEDAEQRVRQQENWSLAPAAMCWEIAESRAYFSRPPANHHNTTIILPADVTYLIVSGEVTFSTEHGHYELLRWDSIRISAGCPHVVYGPGTAFVVTQPSALSYVGLRALSLTPHTGRTLRRVLSQRSWRDDS